MYVLFEIVLPVLFPLAIIGLGAALAISPDKCLKYFPLRKGGELLAVWNRVSIRVTGMMLMGMGFMMFYEWAA
jgi:hypothetical protein